MTVLPHNRGTVPRPGITAVVPRRGIYCTVFFVQVGSRRVIQVAAILLLLFGMLGKFGALFVTIPDPVVGGVLLVMFGMPVVLCFDRNLLSVAVVCIYQF